jgi:porin
MQNRDKTNIRTTRATYLRAIAASMVGAGLLVSDPGAARADTPNPTPSSKVQHHKKTAHSRKARLSPVSYTGIDSKDAPRNAVAPVPACSRESATALQSTYGIKGWVIPPPKFADSITGDYDCWRTNLAKHGFGLTLYSADITQSNTLNHYVPPSNQQAYAGQRWQGQLAIYSLLTYDLSQYGVPDGQIIAGGGSAQGTDIRYLVNALTLTELAYYQTAFNKALEFQIGYLNLGYQFQGTQVGGNIANVLGYASGIQQEVGGGLQTSVLPTATVKWNITDRFYDKAAVSRSLVPNAVGGLGNSLEQEHYSNPTGIKLTNTANVFGVQYPTSRELIINEIGYRNAAGPNDPMNWVRFDAYYNFSKYEDLQNPGTPAQPGQQVNNMAAQLFVDRQIWQSEPGSSITAYKGLYLGATAAYASPQANSVYEDFGVRAYTYGMFDRPHDQISLIWEHQAFSPYVANPVDNSPACFSGAQCVRHAANTYSLVYNIGLFPGVYVGLGVSYIDHPSASWSPNALAFGSTAAPVNPQLNINHAVNMLGSLYVNL